MHITSTVSNTGLVKSKLRFGFVMVGVVAFVVLNAVVAELFFWSHTDGSPNKSPLKEQQKTTELSAVKPLEIEVNKEIPTISSRENSNDNASVSEQRDPFGAAREMLIHKNVVPVVVDAGLQNTGVTLIAADQDPFKVALALALSQKTPEMVVKVTE